MRARRKATGARRLALVDISLPETCIGAARAVKRELGPTS